MPVHGGVDIIVAGLFDAIWPTRRKVNIRAESRTLALVPNNSLKRLVLPIPTVTVSLVTS